MFILLLIKDHLTFTTTLRGGLYGEVPFYNKVLSIFRSTLAKFLQIIVISPLMRDHLPLKTTMSVVFVEVVPHNNV